jgi:hypothetical protein
MNKDWEKYCLMESRPESCDTCAYNAGIENDACVGPCGQQHCWYSCFVCRYNATDETPCGKPRISF